MCEIMEKIAKEERNEGRIEGETRINTLNSILINLNRFDDLKRAATDKDYQMQLMIEIQKENLLPRQTITNIRAGKNITLETLNKICVMCGLQPGDIIEVVPTDEEKIKYRI
mgnify:CR=1 FL=1